MHGPVAIMSVAAARGRYAFINEPFARMLGMSMAELDAADPYQVWLDVTHPEDLGPERQAIQQMAAGEIDRFQFEKRLLHRQHGYRWVKADAVAGRDAEGRLEILTVFFTDIEASHSEAKARSELESQLRQAQRLGALGKLAGGVAHDFNNRLLIIMGHTELLRRGLPEGSPLAPHADTVLTSAHRAAELTRQLLAYSRRQVLKPESFDLNQTVDRLRRMLERLIGDDIELVTVLGAKHPIYSDPGQIEQVILNLVLNARDAMPGGGRLTLETADSDAADTLSVTLIVRDTGVGIAPEILPRIFEPFFTTKAVGQGTGLGLSTVEGIVSQSGGTTEVRSQLGRGTDVLIRLPRARNAPAKPRYQSQAAAARDGNFETVLVCDDDDGVRNLLVNVLGLRAYTILQARNGRDALEVAKNHVGHIQLLVTDVVMPELGGVDLARELRSVRPTLPVLFVSGYTDDAAFLAAPLEPDTFFLPKPFLPADLTQMVCSILERRRAEGPASELERAVSRER
jgi:PAS domain S-box-containing protein